jgi:hypothetical protein
MARSDAKAEAQAALRGVTTTATPLISHKGNPDRVCLFAALSAAGLRGHPNALRALAVMGLRKMDAAGVLAKRVVKNAAAEYISAVEAGGGGNLLCAEAITQVCGISVRIVRISDGAVGAFSIGAGTLAATIAAVKGHYFALDPVTDSDEWRQEAPPAAYMLPTNGGVVTADQRKRHGGVASGPLIPNGAPRTMAQPLASGEATIVAPGEEAAAAAAFWRWHAAHGDAPAPVFVAQSTIPTLLGRRAAVPFVSGNDATLHEVWISGEAAMEDAGEVGERVSRDLYAYLIVPEGEWRKATEVRLALAEWAEAHAATKPQLSGGAHRTSQRWGYEAVLTVLDTEARQLLGKSGTTARGHTVVLREPAEDHRLGLSVIWLTEQAATRVATARELAERTGAEGGVALDAGYHRLGIRVQDAETARVILGDAARPTRAPGYRVHGLPPEYRIADVTEALKQHAGWDITSTNRTEMWRTTSRPVWWVRAKKPPPQPWLMLGPRVVTIRAETAADVRAGGGGGRGSGTGHGKGGGKHGYGNKVVSVILPQLKEDNNGSSGRAGRRNVVEEASGKNREKGKAGGGGETKGRKAGKEAKPAVNGSAGRAIPGSAVVGKPHACQQQQQQQQQEQQRRHQLTAELQQAREAAETATRAAEAATRAAEAMPKTSERPAAVTAAATADPRWDGILSRLDDLEKRREMDATASQRTIERITSTVATMQQTTAEEVQSLSRTVEAIATAQQEARSATTQQLAMLQTAQNEANAAAREQFAMLTSAIARLTDAHQQTQSCSPTPTVIATPAEGWPATPTDCAAQPDSVMHPQTATPAAGTPAVARTKGKVEVNGDTVTSTRKTLFTDISPTDTAPAVTPRQGAKKTRGKPKSE